MLLVRTQSISSPCSEWQILGSLSAWAESLRWYAGASTPGALPWTSVQAACWVTLMFLQDYVHLSSCFSWILEERWVRLAPRTQHNLLWLLNFEVLLDQDVLISYFIHADKFFNCFFWLWLFALVICFFWLWLFALFLLFFPCSFSYTFTRNLYKHILIRFFFDNSKLINNESILYTYIKNKFFTQWYCQIVVKVHELVRMNEALLFFKSLLCFLI